MGRLQAECLGGALGGRGAIGLLAGPTDSLPMLEQSQGFRETLKKQFPNLTLVADQASAVNRSFAAELVADWLQRWPNLVGLAAEAEEPALGALDALAEAERLGQIKVAATNLGPLGERSLRDGGFQCETVEQAVAEGRAAIRNAQAYLASQPYERNVKSPPSWSPTTASTRPTGRPSAPRANRADLIRTKNAPELGSGASRRA